MGQDQYKKIAYQNGHLAHCHIFKPIVNHAKREGGIELKAKVGETTLSILLWRQLDIRDEDLLLALLSLARPQHTTEEIDADDTEESAIELWKKLEVSLVPEKSSIVIHTTKNELLTYMNKQAGKAAYSCLIDSIKRLQGTQILYENEHIKGGFNLLSWLELDDGSLKVAINPISAAVLIGDKKVSYVEHDLDERYDLPAGICRRIHGIFNTHSTKRGAGQINLLVLARKVWSEEEISLKQLRSLKGKCLQLKKLKSWSVRIEGRGNKATVKWSKIPPQKSLK